MNLKFVATFFLLILSFSNTHAQSNLEVSYKILEFFKTNQFDSVPNYFSSTVRSKVTPQMLKQGWDQLNLIVGRYITSREPSVEKSEDIEKIIIPCQFGSSIFPLQISFIDKKIVGLMFLNPAIYSNYKKPNYAIDSLFVEKEISVRTGKYILPGIITMPKKLDKFPIVIFIHGSGPSDKDETVGATKVFKDLAYGLAANGIGSLRYDKRTKKYARQMADNDSLTLKEEVIEDVLSAIKLIKDSVTKENSDIYLLGHSLGGMCIPLITTQSPDIKGVIMMAANTRPLEDMLIDQLTYLKNNDTTLTDAKKQQMDNVISSVSDYKKNKHVENYEDVPLDLPKSYWKFLDNYNQVSIAKELNCKTLILQGERDYQVTMVDFNIWKNELKNKKNVAFKSYPSLNHLFISGKNKSLPIEYEDSANMDINVINDISRWIKSN